MSNFTTLLLSGKNWIERQRHEGKAHDINNI